MGLDSLCGAQSRRSFEQASHLPGDVKVRPRTERAAKAAKRWDFRANLGGPLIEQDPNGLRSSAQVAVSYEGKCPPFDGQGRWLRILFL